MGTRGLQSLGGRPQGRGCLLLAVAGTSSLLTLLLAVPITVLAVLALVPQDRGGWVERTAASGAQAQKGLDANRPSCLLPSSPSPSGTLDSGLHPQIPSPRNPGSPSARSSPDARVATTVPAVVGPVPVSGFQGLRKEPGADLGPRLPAAHLIGAWRSGQGLGWEAGKEEAFLRSGARFLGPDGLALPRAGVYYVYCHVGYRGRAPPAGRGRAASLTLSSSLYRRGGAYGAGSPELLLEGAETVTPGAGRAGSGSLWFTSVGFGGLVQLRSGERVQVNISHPALVDYRRGKTFFGAVMVA